MEKTTAKSTTTTQPVSKVQEKVVSKPVEIELKTGLEDSGAPAPAPKPEKVQTDVRAKLAKRTDNEDMFIPSTPKQLEEDAKEVAKDAGFDFNRGTSVGARLMARSRQNSPK